MNSSNGSPKAFIQDGYTRTSYMAADPSGLYPAVLLTHRPMLVVNQAVIYDELRKVDARKRQMIAAEAIKNYIISWDIEGLSHEDSTQILKLLPKVFDRMFNIICGEEGGDPLPDNSKEQHRCQQLLEDALAGKTEEADLKN